MTLYKGSWFGRKLARGGVGLLLALLLLAALSTVVWAEPTSITDGDLQNSAFNDGSVNAEEYSGYSEGINAGGGNVIGDESKIYVDAGGTDDAVYFGFVPKPDSTLGQSHIVIYIDSVDGGFNSTSPLADAADAHRQVVSAYNGSSSTDLFFAPDFYADYAVSISPLSVAMFELVSADNSLREINEASLSFADDDSGDFEVDFPMQEIGLTEEGGTFKYVITLMHPRGYRYNEFHGVSQATYSEKWPEPGNSSTLGEFHLQDNDYNVFSAGSALQVGLLATEASSPGPSASIVLWPLLLALLTAPLLLRRRRRRWE